MLKSIATLPQYPLNEQQSDMMIRLIIMEKKEPDSVDKILQDVQSNSIIRIMQGRCPDNLKLGPATIIFLSSSGLIESPAVIMMYLHAMYADARSRNAFESVYTMSDLCNLFAMGFPTHDSMEPIWDAQKFYDESSRERVNLIDDVANW